MFCISSWTPKHQSMSVWKKNEQETHPLLERPHPCFNKCSYQKTLKCVVHLLFSGSTFGLTKMSQLQVMHIWCLYLLDFKQESVQTSHDQNGDNILKPPIPGTDPMEWQCHHACFPGNRWRLAYLQPKHCSTPAPCRQKQQLLAGRWPAFWEGKIGASNHWCFFLWGTCLSHCFGIESIEPKFLQQESIHGSQGKLNQTANQPLSEWQMYLCIDCIYIYMHVCH